MSAIHLLLGLLVLAYFGGILVSGRTIRGYALPSGSEYVLLGVVLGPHLLGMLDGATVRAFEPVVQVGLCWLSLVVGIDYGFIGERRVPWRRLLAGILITLLCAAFIGCAVFALALGTLGFGSRDALLLGLSLGAVSCETTRHAVRWVAVRHAAHGPVSDLVADIADADDAVPLVLIAALFAIAPAPGRAIPIPAWAGITSSVGVGLALGALIAALVRRQLRPTELWGLLLGSTLLGIGTLTRVGLSAITTTFAMGLALITLSRHRVELRAAINRTEHAVLLPTLLLAGAQVSLDLPWQAIALVAIALLARLIIKLFSGALLRLHRPARASGWILGLGLMPAGSLTICVGVACAFRLPGAIGSMVLTVAAANVLFGELIGPASLRLALLRAGETKVAARAPANRDEQPSIEEATP